MDELNNECNNVEEDKINDSYTSYESNTQNCTELVNKSCSENIVEEVDKTTKNTENLIRELSAEDQDGSSVVITTSKQSSSNDLIEKSEHSFLKQSGNSRTNEDDFVDENMTKFFSNETEDNKMDKNSGNSEENFKNKNKSDNCKSPINNLVFENSDISSDNIIIKNEEETDGTACENNFAENSFSPKTHQKSPVHKLLEDVTNSDDTDVEEKIELPCRETKTDKNIDNELCETTKKLMIQIPDVNDSNYVPDNDFDEDLASETSNENDDSDTEIVTNNTENDKLLENVKSELEGNDDLSDVEKNNDNTNLKNVAETNINVLNYVNTNLPNTELSNIDISNLDVNKPVDIVDRNQSEASHSDLIDDLSDFIGFDSSSAEKTVQIIQILHERQEKLEQSLQNTFSKEESDDTVDSDYQLKMNSENEEVNNEINSITSLKEEQTKVSRENDSIVSANKINYVYELTKEINIFEEQVPSGSKRVKKKKKFFGDFEDTDDISSKKQNVSKEHAETSKLVNNFGENKENVIADDKLKEEVISENESMVTTPSSIPPVSKVQNKPKRVFFDISNPLFREPFKYGWKREICYRNLPEGSKSKSAYVSYFNPLGKKFKTIRQIVEHLPPGSQLNMKHFTFSKERIFSEEEASDFEVIRRMKTSTGLNETETSNKTIGSDNPEYNGSVSSEEQSKLNSKKKASSSRSKVVGNTSFNENEISTPKLKISKRPKTKQEESEEEMAETTIGSSSKMTMPKILIRGVSSNSKSGSLKFKVSSGKSSSHKKAKKSKKVSDRSSKCKEMAKSSDEMEDESLTENESSLTYVSTSSFPMSTSNQTEEDEMLVCSINCSKALGRIPTLQCTVCLDLYHFECCGVDIDSHVNSFICKKCRLLHREHTENRGSSTKYLLAVSESANSVCLVGNNVECTPGISKNTKIVDGVTTWLSSSSNIQLSSKNTSTSCGATPTLETQTSLLQSVLELDGRRYIIVPKESIVSISPNTNSNIEAFGEFEQQQQNLNGTNTENCALSPVNSASSIDSSMNAVAEGTSNSFLVNPSNVNSAGVLLVPVLPSDDIHSPRYYSSDVCNQVEFTTCEMNECGSTRSLKRKHSDDIDVALCRDKIPKLDSQFSSSTFRTSLTLSNICCLYDPLILCLKYLTVRELLRVSMTCKYLNRLASDSSLWTIVRLKNSKITDWEGFGRALQKHGTKRLDMRKMLCPTAIDDLETMWNNFFEVIPNIKSLEHIDFMRCTSNVVHKVAQTCLNLTVINAVQLKSSMPSLDSFTKLKYLRELRLRGLQSLNMETNESKLNFICNDTLQVLSLTSIKNLNVDTLEAISELQNLHTLELGECESLPNNFSEIIGKLYKLERLRLEKVTNLDPEYSIFAVLRNLQHFKYLELINFEVKVGFDQAIATCQNIEKFLLIPLYLHQSATANKVIVNGLQKLSKTLKCFVWGLTTELLKVTGIFVDQYQGKHNDGDSNSKNGDMGCAKKHFDCIPILKALSSEGNNTPEVDILSVSSLEKILTKMLPQARVKVLKMPYSLTWRQSLSECFK